MPGGVRKQYTVRPGDTLWGIAQQALGSGQRYREIAGLNTGQVGDPGQIQPGWVLDMPADAHGPGVQTVPASGGGSNGSGSNGNGGNGVAGGDHVMVDLQRAQAAASALEGLRDTLAQHVPAILTAISNLRAEGANLPPPTTVQQLQSRSPQDAAEMRAAARLAAAMNNLKPGSGGGMVTLPAAWDSAALDDAAAKLDAQALLAATTGKDKSADYAAIAAVTQDLADHQGDTAYLTAFWSQNGVPAAAANLAGTLNRLDGGVNQLSPADQKVLRTGQGTLSEQGQKFLENGGGAQLLSRQDQQILSTFSTALAATTKAGTLDSAASQQLVTAFAHPADLWSAGMLFKYGPDGAAYGTTADGTGPKLLSGITEALLYAREHGGYTIPLQARFAEVNPANPSQITDGDPTKQLAQWGPLEPVLQRATENGVAATQVINGYDPATGKTDQQQGVIWAHQLMQPPKITYNAPMGTGMNAGNGVFTIRDLNAYPDGMPAPMGQWGYISIPDSTSANFLYAATADHSSSADAQAVLNIMQANSQINPSSTTLSQPIREAFLKIADSRAPDLAMSAEGQTTQPGITSVNGVPFAVADQQQLDTFLRQALHDPKDAGAYQGRLDAKITGAVESTVKTNNSWLRAMGSLEGMVQRVEGENSFDGAEKAAAQKAKEQAFASAMIAPLMLIPTPAPGTDAGAVMLFGPPLAKLMLTSADSAIAYNISGGDPAKALQINDEAFVGDKTYVRIPVVQGLIDTGVVKPDPSWFQHGHVVANAAFEGWYLQHGRDTFHGETLDQWVQDAVDAIQGQQ